MQREIKFMAWYKEAEQTLTVRDINFCGEELDTYEMDGDWLSFDDVELLQFTGLHDKNGIEIYEGDICRGTRGGSKYIFVVKWDEEDARFLGFTNNGYICYVGQEPCVEVIGNIYENSELLKEA